MARRLDITQVEDNAEMPLKRGTLQFLQDAFNEMFSGFIQAFLSGYNPNTVYILWGAQNSGTYPAYTIAPGLAFYQGELFYIDGTSFAAVGSNVAVCTIGTTQYTSTDGTTQDADPVQFTDTTLHNMHNIRKIVIVGAASGSGICDYSAVSFKSFIIPPQLQLTAPTPVGGVANNTTVGGTYPNLTVFTPVGDNAHPVLDCGTVNVGDVPGGGADGVTIAIPFNITVGAGIQYIFGCCLVSDSSDPQHDATTIPVLVDGSQTQTGCSVHFREVISDTQSLKLNWWIIQK